MNLYILRDKNTLECWCGVGKEWSKSAEPTLYRRESHAKSAFTQLKTYVTIKDISKRKITIVTFVAKEVRSKMI